MQGFWPRSKPWRPSKTPRQRPLNQGPALEWTFKGNMTEVLSVQCVFFDQFDVSGPPSKPKKPHLAAPAQESAPRAPPASEKMKLTFLLNGSEPAPPPPPKPVPEVKSCGKREGAPIEYTFYTPNAAKRRRAST